MNSTEDLKLAHFPDHPAFICIFICEIVLGLISSCQALLNSLTFYKISTYPSNVLYVMKWIGICAAIASLQTALFGVYNLYIFISGKLFVIHKVVCGTFWLLYNGSSRVVIFCVELLILERYWTTWKRDYSNPHDSISKKFRYFTFTIVILAIATRMVGLDFGIDTFQYTNYCSLYYMTIKSTFADYIAIILVAFLVVYMIAGILLYRMYIKAYQSFTSLSTSHDLQERYETMANIRSMTVLLWILIPTLVIAILLNIVNVYAVKISSWMGDNLIYTQNIPIVVGAIETSVLSALFLVGAPHVRQQIGKMFSFMLRRQAKVGDVTTMAMSVTNSSKYVVDYKKNVDDAVDEILGVWIKMDKEIKKNRKRAS